MTKITFGDCSCLYKKERDIISESLRDSLRKMESDIRKEKSKRKQDPPFIKYLKDMWILDMIHRRYCQDDKFSK